MTAPSFRRSRPPEEIYALGTRTDIPTAGAILGGLSRAQSYRAAAAGRLPVVILRVGRRQVVTVASILTALGLPAAPPLPGPGDRSQDVSHDSDPAGEQPGQGAVVRQLRRSSP